MGPRRSSTVSIILPAASASVRSAATPNASFSSAQARSTLSREREQIAIRAPSAAKAEAQARPMPFEPPVTRTTLPSRPNSMA